MMLTDAPARQKASTMQVSTSSRSNSGVGSAIVPSLLPTLPGSRRGGGVRSSDKLAPGQAQDTGLQLRRSNGTSNPSVRSISSNKRKEAEMNLKPVIIASTL